MKIVKGELISVSESDIVNGNITIPNSVTSIGSYCFWSLASITSITINRKKLNVKCIDNILFVIDSEKTTKGIKIYSGYNFIKLADKKIVKEECFVANKGEHFAHGESIKKAIQDVQFKAIAETLRKEPIKKDTIITMQYYRIVTGACEMGCKSWMQKNNITKESYKASELLPLLEKTNAYGLERFKSLITF